MPNQPLKICIIAGEASGDIIGAKLVKELKTKHPKLKFIGLGGPNLAKEGLESLFDMKEISVMGFLEVLPNIFRIRKRLLQMAQYIIDEKPALVVTIDSFGFNSRVIKRVREQLGSSIKIVHYVAPTVWAYKPERAKTIAALYDLQLTILPFEKEYFDNVGVKCEYVGHPIVEDSTEPLISKTEIANKYGFDPTKENLVVIMPGSRLQEVEFHGVLFAEVFKEVKSIYPQIKAFIPTLPHLKNLVDKIFSNLDAIISDRLEDKSNLLPFAKCAIVKSGTSSLEMALYKIPTVVAYKMNPLTFWYIKNKLNIKYASLINLLNDQEIFRERIQGMCNKDNLVKDLKELFLSDQHNLMLACEKTINLLGKNEDSSPSKKAAVHLLNLLN